MQEQYGLNVLHIALNIKEVLKCLINLLVDTIDEELLQQMADKGMTPLHLACWHHKDIILSVLIK